MKYYLDVYGCQMNVAESEGIRGILEESGWQSTHDKGSCDLLIFYTCTVRETADHKIYGNIGAAKRYKKNNPNMIIALGGCMAHNKDTLDIIKKSYPQVDIIFGTAAPYNLLDYVDAQRQQKSLYLALDGKRDMEYIPPAVRDDKICAKVNIMNGCDKFCAFCIVPYVRGRETSRSFDSIVYEVSRLVFDGYKEITLIGQNVNSYSYKGKTFADLLIALNGIVGKFRIKFTSPHPQDINQEVIDIVANGSNIAKTIHLPLQAGSDRVLQRMRRSYDRQRYLNLISDIYETMPNCGLTTDIMVGFPTETEQDFLDTLNIVERAYYSNIYSFVYSRRSGTPAARMQGQVDDATKKDRITRLIELQAQIAKQRASERVGARYEVLCTDIDDDKALCRSVCDRIIIIPKAQIKKGQFGYAEITHARNSNLYGKIVSQSLI